MHDEVKCLRERTIPDVPDSLDVTLHNPHICIAYLNIWGLRSKKLCKSEDISLDVKCRKLMLCVLQTHIGSMGLNVHLIILALVTAKRYTGMTGVGKVKVLYVLRKPWNHKGSIHVKFILKLLAYKLTSYTK